MTVEENKDIYTPPQSALDALKGRNKKDGYIMDCLLQARESEIMFTVNETGKIIPTLLGYAIIPIEEYNALCSDKS